jgi:hypothetical protein
MARNKRRRDPLEQGVLRTIYQWFIGPLVRHKPHQWTLAEFHGEIFHLKTRDITRWKVNKRFNMPGLLYVAGAVKIQGTGYRNVQPGHRLWVRLDANAPDSVDVEWVGTIDQTFQMSRNQWEWVRLHCEEEFVEEDEDDKKPARRRSYK